MPTNEDWSKGTKRKHIELDRQYLWREDTVELIAGWVGIRPGMTVVDVGCGLGYLGRTYWKYYGYGGLYVGFDISSDLLLEAMELSEEWAENGASLFSLADAYRLPLPDNCADLSMCQTMLMHLDRPEDALAEMIRVAKPGGTVMCKEPDHISAQSAQTYSSLPAPSIEERLNELRALLITVEGRKKLGKGDRGIGIKIPKMMADLGLIGIDARSNDLVFLVQPPYETEQQQFHMARARERLESDEELADWEREFKECYAAGGGSQSSCNRYLEYAREQREKIAKLYRNQVEDGSYFACGARCSSFFCVKGIKPEAT
jgi:SAM-dependent methyltransferase